MTPESSGDPGAPSSMPEDAGVRMVRLTAASAWRVPVAVAMLVGAVIGLLAWVLWPAGPRGGHAPPAAPVGVQVDSATNAKVSSMVEADTLPVASAAPTAGPSTPRTPAATVAEPSAPPASTTEVEADPNDLARYIRPGDPEPRMAEVIHALRETGDREGIAAFNPPGTSPPLVGLVVPADYALPPGYVRHHQVTDAGEPLAPILMYAPDVQLRDAAGNPVPIPEDRVVPPERAPPGLPILQIEIPPPPGG